MRLKVKSLEIPPDGKEDRKKRRRLSGDCIRLHSIKTTSINIPKDKR